MTLEQKHELVTAISVEVFPGVLQTEQKHIGKWREAIEAEINIQHSKTYRRPPGARYLVGSTLAPMCKSRYPVHFVAVAAKSTRTIVDQAFSVPKRVRLECENVRKIILVTVQNVFSSSRENQGGVRVDTGKEVHVVRQLKLQ